jgi:ATP-dependent protease ClpP protease subunit
MAITVNCRAKTREAELLIYGAIGSWDDITDASVAKALREAGEVESIVARINSPGGDMYMGIAIHNLLKAQRARVTTVVDGMAASAASIIMMAGDRREIASNARVMIHDPWTIAMGGSAELRKAADLLDGFREDAVISYTDALGDKATRAQIDEWMRAETWMDSKTAIERGFATHLSESQNIKNEAGPLNTAILSKYKNLPAELAEQVNTPDARLAHMRFRVLRHQIRQNGGPARKPA